jgi:hypothetical protein
VAECLFSCNLQSFQTLGPQLKIEDNKILLKTAVKTPSGFIEFKNLFEANAKNDVVSIEIKKATSENYLNYLKVIENKAEGDKNTKIV